jgi:transcriptional regulator GlxA family with amidase domain
LLLAERFVRRNLGRNITIGELARAARVSARTLTRRMHKALGFAPLQFVQRLKVERAVHLLGTTKLAFEEIARRVGYEDPGALRRLLRREFGATARSFRNTAG